MRPAANRHLTVRDRVFLAVNGFGLSVLVLLFLYPLVYVVSASFSSPGAVVSGRVWLFPVDVSLAGYRAVFRHEAIWTGYGNSFFYMTAGTTINVVMTVLMAYPLAKPGFYGRGFFTFLLVFTMMFNGGLIPTFLLVRRLGLYNTRWALLITQALTPFNVIIARTYFRHSIPRELYDSAVIDGASDTRYIHSILLPLSKPMLAVIALYYAVWHWNQFFWALVYLSDRALYPLQLVLRDILIRNEVSIEAVGGDILELERLQGMADLLKYSLSVVASVPVLVVYPFVQKYFVKGVMIGALKG